MPDCFFSFQARIEPSGISLEELRKHPEGLAYKPVRYNVRHKSKDFPFILTTGARKSLLYHLRHHNIARFRTVHPTAEVEIHPDDAADLGIKDKQVVLIVSEIGSPGTWGRI